MSGLLPWLGLAVAVLGLVAMVGAWFSAVTSDTAYVLYTLMVIGGALMFVLLR